MDCDLITALAYLTLAMLALSAYTSQTSLRGAAWMGVPVAAFVALICTVVLARGYGATADGVIGSLTWVVGCSILGFLLGDQGRLLGLHHRHRTAWRLEHASEILREDLRPITRRLLAEPRESVE